MSGSRATIVMRTVLLLLFRATLARLRTSPAAHAVLRVTMFFRTGRAMINASSLLSAPARRTAPPRTAAPGDMPRRQRVHAVFRRTPRMPLRSGLACPSRPCALPHGVALALPIHL